MVLKKNLVKDLKKSNKELEKHLSKLNFDKSQIESLTSNSNNMDLEFVGLLSSGIIDLRTEVNLLRKNLSVDIENMVLKQVQVLQQNFFNGMDNFNNKMIIEMKGNFSNYIEDLNSQFNILKKEILNLNSTNFNLEKDLELIKNEISDFKIEILENSKLNGKPNNEIEIKLDFLGNKFVDISNELVKKNNFLENNLVNLNKKLIGFEKDFSNIENIVNLEKNEIVKKISNLSSKINLKKNHILKKKINLDNTLKKKEIKKKIIKEEFDFNLKKIQNFDDSNIDKILNIEKRLQKLNSLK